MIKAYFHHKRDQQASDFFYYYRCFDLDQQIIITARTTNFGKPISIYRDEEIKEPIAEFRNSKGYLVNGKTYIHDLHSGSKIGYYTRLNRLYNSQDIKIGRWRDAQKWSKEFKENLFDALANTLLGSGDIPGGANPSDTHLLSDGNEVIALLQRKQLPFFPDPPKSMKPGMIAKFASKIIPGNLGKSLGEVTPPGGWLLTINKKSSSKTEETLVLYSVLYRIEYIRWSRSF